MPKLSHNRLPKLRHHKASDQGVVELSGEHIYCGAYGTEACTTKYNSELAAWLARGRKARPKAVADPLTEASGYTVTELCADYLAHCESYYVGPDKKPTRTVERVKAAIKIFRAHEKLTPVVQFGPKKLKALREVMIAKDFSRKYINTLTNEICSMVRWGASEEKYPVTVYDALKTVKGLRFGRTLARENPGVEPVADSIVELTLPHLPPIIQDMVRIQRLTGARPGEVCKLHPEFIDQSLDVWLFKPPTHKTQYLGKSRTIAIGPRAQLILTKYLDKKKKRYCFVPAESDRERRKRLNRQRKTPLSCGNKVGSNRKASPKRKPGECYTSHSYARAVQRACDAAFPAPKDSTPEQKKQWRKAHRWHPNRLRHSTATELENQFDLFDASLVLGHSKVETTQIYAKKGLRRAIEIARQVG